MKIRMLCVLLSLAAVAGLAGCAGNNATGMTGSLKITEEEVEVSGKGSASAAAGSGQTGSSAKNSSAAGGKQTGSAGNASRSTDVPDRYNPFEPNETKYDVSGRVSTLGGRTIYITGGLVQSDSSLTGAEGLRIANLKKEIEKKYDCKIVTKPRNIEATTASILAGTPDTDIWSMQDDSYFLRAQSAKLLQPLESLKCLDLGDSTKFSNFSQKFKVNGQHYAFYPQLYGYMQICVHGVLYANKTLLKAKGVDINTLYDLQEKGKWTWEEFASVAKKVSDPGADKYAVQDDANGFFYRALMASNSTDYVVMENNKLKFNAAAEPARKVMDFYSRLMTDKSLSPTVARSQQAGIDSYNTGKAYFLAGWPSYHSPKWSIFSEKVMNESAILYIPKPTESAEYKSVIGDTCPVAIPIYSARGGKSADLLARETATIVSELFAPVYSQSEYDRLLTNEMKQAAGNDAHALKTLQGLYAKSYLSFNQMVEQINQDNGKGWIDQIGAIAKNPTSYQSVLDTYSKTYNSYLSALNY